MGTLDYGWIYVERGQANALQLGCKSWKLNIKWNLTQTHQDLVGDGHIGFDPQIISRELVLMDTFFKNTADVEAFLQRVYAFNAAGKMTIEIRVSDAALPGSLFNIRTGVNSMEMLIESIQGLEKVAYGNGTVYKIGMVRFKQAG